MVGFDLPTLQGVKWRNRLYKSPPGQEQKLIKVSRKKAHLCKKTSREVNDLSFAITIKENNRYKTKDNQES